MPTIRQLLSQSEIIPDPTPERLQQIEAALKDDSQSDMPWYLRLIVAVGAWFACLFIIGSFLALMGFHDDNRSGYAIFGGILLIGATVLANARLGVFMEQCCLAAGLAGQGLLYAGLLPDHDPLGNATLISVVLAAALYLIYPDFLMRMITSLIAIQLTLEWVLHWRGYDPAASLFFSQSAPEIPIWIPALVAVCYIVRVVVMAGCFVPVIRQSANLAPLGYALVLSLAAWPLLGLFGFAMHSGPIFDGILYPHHYPVWLNYINPVFTAVSILALATWAAGGTGAWKIHAIPFAGLAGVLAVIIWTGASTILLPVLLIMLGFFTQRRVILGFGLILLPIFLSFYYYNLSLDLLAKSATLIVSGLALLLLRSLLRRGEIAEQPTL